MRVSPLGLVAAALASLPSIASAQVCIGGLSKTEYLGGFRPTDINLPSSINASLVLPTPNAAQLNAGQVSGQIVSQIVSTEIATLGLPNENNYTIGHVRFQATAAFPPPCPVPPASTLGGTASSRIDLYYSVDNGFHWEPVEWPPGTVTSGDVLIDNLELGVAGNQLVWRAVFLAGAAAGCQPQLTSLVVGYEGVPAGVYQQSEAVPIGNVMLRSTYEMASSTWVNGNYFDPTLGIWVGVETPRGHVTAKELYNLDTVPNIDYTDGAHTPPNVWAAGDAGSLITWAVPPAPGNGPDLRSIYFNNSGPFAAFATATAGLAKLVLNPLIRADTYQGQLVYNFDNTGASMNVVDDTDGNWLVNWVRGWANGNAKTKTKSWGLGAIVNSTPAVAGPPGDPWWLPLSGTPAAERTQFGTPCTPTPGTYNTTWSTRNALAIVGSQDGLFHAFDMGAFRWCDDPGTSILDTNGWFASAGARNYGTGREVWAYAPPGQMDSYRSQLPPSQPFAIATAPGQPTTPPATPPALPTGVLARASTDASPTILDACIGIPPCAFKTVMVSGETRTHPYVTAIDITNPANPPQPIWPADWPPATELDSTFEGTEQPPSAGPTNVNGGGRRWEAAVSSGLASVPTDFYLYLIDLVGGVTWNNAGTRDGYGRVKMNVVGANADCSGQVYGSAGSPVMVDSDGDGVVDRLYVVDTKGCLYKVETATMVPCVMAALGETVYAPIAVNVPDTVSNDVDIYVVGGDSPTLLDLPASPPNFHAFALEDDDQPGACNPPKKLFIATLPTGVPASVVYKSWSAPVVSNDTLYISASVGDLEDQCAADPANPGLLLGYLLTPSVTGVPQQVLSQSLGGNGAGGVQLYDGHLFANSSNGTTTVLGRPSSWATSAQVNGHSTSQFSNPLWTEH